MKCKNVLRGVAVYAVTTLFLISCQKEQTPDVNNVEVTNGVKVSGVAPDNPQALARIPMIVSSSFLQLSTQPGAVILSQNARPPKGGRDITPPSVSISSPLNNAAVSGTINILANASDNVGVVLISLKVNSAVV